MPVKNSQKAADAPISFRLESLSGQVYTIPLTIRPEELTYNQPSLQTVTPTLDGAFMDDFGRGVDTIQIAGHTGWGQGDRPDGPHQFLVLHAGVWNQWHDDRAAALAQGQDPSKVRLIWVDSLNGNCVLVAPGQFVLKRSRTRPLLYQYQINMTVLSNRVTIPQSDPVNPANGSSPTGVIAGLASLQNSIGKIQSAISSANSFLNSTIVTPVKAFMSTTSQVMTSVTGLVDGVRGTVSAEAAQLAGVGADLAQSGRNLFLAYNAVANLPDYLAIEVAGVAATYQNAFCILKNCFKQVEEYPDYSGLYGAFNCSSTIGGSPLSAYTNVNPWQTFAPQVSSVAAITPAARSIINATKGFDPVLGSMTISQVGNTAAAIAAGVQVLV